MVVWKSASTTGLVNRDKSNDHGLDVTFVMVKSENEKGPSQNVAISAVKSSNNFAAATREAGVRKKTAGSLARWQRAQRSLAGGVSSSLRRSARPYPLYFTHGEGATLHDVDGNAYCDYTLGWGPNFLGYGAPEVVEALQTQAAKGITFGAQHDLEIEVAEQLTSLIPCADSVCFASSGTEIVQVALRLARAATGRSKHLKFEGHYHGWDDTVLTSYHPSAEQISKSGGAPIPVGAGQASLHNVVVAQWNDRAGVEEAFAANPGAIASVICEPILCNSGCIFPDPGFLEFLRDITRREGAVFIFDEVITGFRLGLQGAQGFFGITPDLALYAKAVGGGMPLSVLAGKAEYMDLIATGKVVHAGTLNGNPLTLAAAKEVLKYLSADNGAVYDRLRNHGATLTDTLENAFASAGVPVAISNAGSVFHLSFLEHRPRNYRELLAANEAMYSDFALALLDEGVLVLPDGRWYLSTAHGEEDVARTVEAIKGVVI
jgi:glutamate-1-semialdehyde 2,1-aminomutase